MKYLFILLAIPALAQPPDLPGFDEFTWGMPLSKAAAVYPNMFHAVKPRRHSAKDLVERLEAPKFPIGNFTMKLSLYTRGDTDTLALIVLASNWNDRGVIRAKYIVDTFTRLLGSPTLNDWRGALNQTTAVVRWFFPTTDIRMSLAGDSYLRLVFLPHGEPWPDFLHAPLRVLTR